MTRASESMASINSIPNMQGNLASHAFRSMTSLKSADDVLLPTNKDTVGEAEPDTKGVKESSDTVDSASGLNGANEKLIEFGPTKPKLVDISPVVQTVDGVTESESNTDNISKTTTNGKQGEKVEETKEESVDGNLGTKGKTSPIVTHQPDSPTRRLVNLFL